MNNLTIEQRLAALEQTVEQLQRGQNGRHPEKDWRRTLGMFTGNDAMRQVFEEALKYRERDREKARRRYSKSRPGKGKVAKKS